MPIFSVAFHNLVFSRNLQVFFTFLITESLEILKVGISRLSGLYRLRKTWHWKIFIMRFIFFVCFQCKVGRGMSVSNRRLLRPDYDYLIKLYQSMLSRRNKFSDGLLGHNLPWIKPPEPLSCDFITKNSNSYNSTSTVLHVKKLF